MVQQVATAQNVVTVQVYKKDSVLTLVTQALLIIIEDV